jgi:photosystem II stability/assembly factor-like uncharacterized protein
MRYLKLALAIVVSCTAYSVWCQTGWTNQMPDSEYPALTGIYAIDSADVWVVGFEGTVIHSTDGGESWDAINTGYNDNFTSVLFINHDTGFVSGSPAEGDAFILRTLDGGANWQRIEMPTSVTTEVNAMDFFYSAAEDSIILFAAGGLGHVWKSKVVGDTWNGLGGGCGNGNYNACCIIDENIGWFVGTPDEGYNFSIMATSDGGLEFFEQTNPEQRKLNGVSFTDASQGIAVGLSSTILYTEDGGGTWENRPNTGYRWQEVEMMQSGKAWAVGSNGNIGYSTDYGYSWSMQESGLTYELWDLSFINDQVGWIAGGGIGNPGVVLHTTTGGTGSTGTAPVMASSTWSLGQNYPNPVTRTTQIKYRIQQPGMVTISLYDVIGNKVAVLLNEFKPEGESTIEIDSDPFPEGVYFYDLKVDTEWIQTRRMVILK